MSTKESAIREIEREYRTYDGSLKDIRRDRRESSVEVRLGEEEKEHTTYLQNVFFCMASRSFFNCFVRPTIEALLLLRFCGDVLIVIY